MAKKKIAVDAGHGKNTPGKRTPDGEREWDFNNKVAKAFTKEMDTYENVECFRTDDPTGKTDPSLTARTNKANNANADIMISFHHNALVGKWGNHTGTETYTYLGNWPQAEKLAKMVQAELVKAYGLRDRGCKKANFAIVRQAKMTSILTEGGYMDSKIDIKKLQDDKVLENAGKGAAKAVAQFLGLKKKPSNTGTVTPAKPVVKGDEVKNDDKTVLFRVRKSKDDAKTQLGAFGNINSAKDLADKNSGYEVYDIHNNLVYTPKKTEPKKATPTPVKVTPKPASGDNKAIVAYPGKLIKKGSKGKDVERVQRAVGVKADGIFGAGTEKAVKAYQKRKGLSADGIVGKNTWNMMF